MLQKKIIVLKKIKYAETNLILHTLSSEGERLNFIARHAVKGSKRFATGTLDPLHYLNVSYTEAKSGDLNLLKEAQIIEDFYSLRKNYDCLNISLYFLSFVSKLTHESLDGNKELFNLLGNTLKILKKFSKQDVKEDILNQLKLRFEMKALHQQGVYPEGLGDSDLLSKSILEHPISLSSEDLIKTEAIKLKIHHSLKEYLPNFKKGF
ncbi:MAG: DNA repair protein RecO [Bdellovibrionales bacterium]|nr:DNA repair protein RecO [Bdellovibrionales bacterium]